MSYIMPHLAFQFIIKKCFKMLKNNPEYIDEIFEYYTTPEFAGYFEGYRDTIKQWILTSKIHVVSVYPANFENLPLICVQTLSETEDLSKEGMGDFYEDNSVFPFEERTEYINLLHYTMNCTVQISIFASKNNDSVYWINNIINWTIIQYKQYLAKLGVCQPTISASEKSLNRSYPNETVFSRFVTVNCYTVNVIRSAFFPDEVTEIDTQFYARPEFPGDPDILTLENKLEL